MDDIAESQDLSKEISEAISNPVAFGTDVDEVRDIIFLLFVFFHFLSCVQATVVRFAHQSSQV